jgi:redox-sensitive bicupin YhaK (pirin superfamily)
MSLHATVEAAPRPIVYKTRGRGHGPIVRLMSPGDLGAALKPFVFLDLFSAKSQFMGTMPLHPHSGIATITVITEGDVRFDDPFSGSGTIDYGGVEWMRAGGGVWHGKEMSAGASADVRGFQLWIALPPELENGPVDSQYIESRHIPEVGPARLVVGRYREAQSPVRSPDGLNYLLVTLGAGETWTYVPPHGHEVAWIAVSRGRVNDAETGEMAVFKPGLEPIALTAGPDGPATFVLASAVPHPHDLVTGYYSVHTTPEALAIGEAGIERLKARLTVDPNTPGTVPVFRG